MQFTNQLKQQLTNFVDTYKKHFRQTLGVTISFTILTMLIVAVLSDNSIYGKGIAKAPTSLLSYFFRRYSSYDGYSIVDLSKSVYIFFIALFSIGLAKLSDEDALLKDLSFKHILKPISGKDISALGTALLLSGIMDYILVQLQRYGTYDITTRKIELDYFIQDLIFNLRVYIPLIIFALTVQYQLKTKQLKIDLKRIVFLYVSLWIINEFAYEFFIWCKQLIIGLILLPFANSEYRYVFESILGIPVFAFFFLGYASAMIGVSANLVVKANEQPDTLPSE
jgi:hypothetical protein